jgi:hypothetical protein
MSVAARSRPPSQAWRWSAGSLSQVPEPLAGDPLAGELAALGPALESSASLLARDGARAARRDPLIYDPDWAERERLKAWRRAAAASQSEPPLLAAACAVGRIVGAIPLPCPVRFRRAAVAVAAQTFEAGGAQRPVRRGPYDPAARLQHGLGSGHLNASAILCQCGRRSGRGGRRFESSHSDQRLHI